MIEHVYTRVARTTGVDAVVVATDDERIAAAVERFGGVVRMTDAGHRTGTDRIGQVARELDCEILVNVQGDLPLIEPAMIREAIEPLSIDPALPMSTLRRCIDDAAEYFNPNVVKVIVNLRGEALYFSRAPIPWLRQGAGPADAGRDGAKAGDSAGSAETRLGTAAASGSSHTYKHIGLYAYRRDFLLMFARLPPTPLEQVESLEQLRALEHGYRIGTVETRYESIEVDTPEDLERVRRSVAVTARA